MDFFRNLVARLEALSPKVHLGLAFALGFLLGSLLA